jgi:hypothetical protein
MRMPKGLGWCDSLDHVFGGLRRGRIGRWWEPTMPSSGRRSKTRFYSRRPGELLQRPATGIFRHSGRGHPFHACRAGNQTINYSGKLTSWNSSSSSWHQRRLSPITSSARSSDQQPDGKLGCHGARHAFAHLSLQKSQHWSGRSSQCCDSLGAGRPCQWNRHHHRKRRHLQRRPASNGQLESQWFGRGALRRQRIHSGQLRGSPGITECIPGTGQGPGRRSRAHSTTWNGITTPTTTRPPLPRAIPV